MDSYRHHVSGFFVYRQDAEEARAKLFALGLPPGRVQLFAADSALPETVPQAEGNKVLTSVIKDGVIGSAVGGGIGALVDVALVATSVSLVVANPLIPTLALLGWGAGLGGILGGIVGATSGYTGGTEGEKAGKLAALIKDAVLNGQFVLVAETLSKTETANVRKIIQKAVGEYKDLNK